MPRKKSTIQVVLHLPDNPEDIKKIQNIFDRTYCRCIAKRLENLSLTADEKSTLWEGLLKNSRKITRCRIDCRQRLFFAMLYEIPRCRLGLPPRNYGNHLGNCRRMLCKGQ